MRILFTTSLYPTPKVPFALGGAELFVRRLAEDLVRDGHEIEILRTKSTEEGAAEVVNGVTVHSAPIRNLYDPFHSSPSAPVKALWHLVDDYVSSGSALAKRIAEFRPDVMHSNTVAGLGTGIWKVARDAGLPVVHTLHDYYLTCPRCGRFRDGAICEVTCGSCSVLTRSRQRRSGDLTAVVGVSRRVLDIHCQLGLFRDTPIRTVVRNASDLAGFIDPPVSAGPLTFGFIGRTSIEKGVDMLVEAFGSLPRGAARLVIAGRTTPDIQARLKASAPSADIEFLGYAKPVDFFAKVDVVAVPSLWEEPGALVMEEALVAGRPIIATPFGAMPEVIDNGRNGWIVEPTVSAIAAQMRAIIDAPATVREMQNELMHNVDHRTMRDVREGYLAVYQEAIEHASGARSNRSGRSAR